MAFTLSTLDRLGYRFLKLPRELRDLVYQYVFTEESPFNITNTDLRVPVEHPIVPVEHPIIYAEWLEAIYTYNVCSITLSNTADLEHLKFRRSIWGTHPEYKQFIRRLIVNTTEAILDEKDPEKLEHECTAAKPWVRQEWNDLLALPRLESLTINLQKSQAKFFTWADFGPVIYRLREQLPKLRIMLNISFDNILEHAWNIESSLYIDGVFVPPENQYLSMGFVDVSELIEKPTDDDRSYVEEYLPGTREVGERDVVRGLLDETPGHRRLLAPHYVVQEPALLRILMEEHYQVYKRVWDLRAADEEHVC